MIRVYTSPNCQGCRATKRWLTERSIPHETVDISLDENAADLAAIKAMGYVKAPVIFVGDPTKPDAHWYGHNPVLLAHHTEGLGAAA